MVTILIAARETPNAVERDTAANAAGWEEDEPYEILLARPDPRRGEFFSAISSIHLLRVFRRASEKSSIVEADMRIKI